MRLTLVDLAGLILVKLDWSILLYFLVANTFQVMLLAVVAWAVRRHKGRIWRESSRFEDRFLLVVWSFFETLGDRLMTIFRRLRELMRFLLGSTEWGLVKKRVRRWGIPIALVIIATGAAMLFQNVSATILVVIYLVAVLASSLKLGWRSGVTAMLAGLATLTYGFSAHAGAGAAFIICSLIAIGASEVRLNAPPRDPAVLPDHITTASDRQTEDIDGCDSRKKRWSAASKSSIEKPKRASARPQNAPRANKPKPSARLKSGWRLSGCCSRCNCKGTSRRGTGSRGRLAAERQERERLERERDQLARQLEERIAAPRPSEQRSDMEDAAEERLATLEREKKELARRLTEERAQARLEAENALEERLLPQNAPREQAEAQRG